MSASGAAVGSLAAVGGLALTVFILYVLAYHLKQYVPPGPAPFPSYRAMDKVFAHCPDGWVYKGIRKDASGGSYDVCQNSFNVPVCRSFTTRTKPDGTTEPGCYSDLASKTAVFPRLNNWKDVLSGKESAEYQKSWVTRCSSPSGISGGAAQGSCDGLPPAAWTGISNLI